MTKAQEVEVQQREQHWLLHQIVSPQLPQLLETLDLCSQLLTSRTPVKLPITSARTEHVKGILTRTGLDITDLSIVLDLPTLGKKLPLQLQRKLPLTQLQRLLDLIEEVTQEVVWLQHQLDHEETEEHERVEVVQNRMNSVLQLLIQCNNVLNKPSEELMFPKHLVLLSDLFHGTSNLAQYQDKLTIDFFVLNGELSIECKSLHKVTHPPWDAVTNGKSLIDTLREDLKHHKTTINEIVEKYNHTGLSLKHALGFSKFDIHDYLTRGITFKDIVVIEMENSLVHCQDPHLLSISTKIKYLEHQVSKMYNNLSITML